MEKKYCVYMHENKENGKKYIGVSCNIKRRWQKGKGYKCSYHFNRAIEKYGWDGFKHKILLKNLTKDEAYEKEKELIKQYNTTNQEYGYNISEGGEIPADKIIKKMIRAKKDRNRMVVITSDRWHKEPIYYKNLDEASIKTGIDREFLYRCCIKEEISPRGYSIDFCK